MTPEQLLKAVLNVQLNRAVALSIKSAIQGSGLTEQQVGKLLWESVWETVEASSVPEFPTDRRYPSVNKTD